MADAAVQEVRELMLGWNDWPHAPPGWTMFIAAGQGWQAGDIISSRFPSPEAAVAYAAAEFPDATVYGMWISGD